MTLTTSKFASIALLFISMSQAVACAQGLSISLKSQGGEIIFAEPENGSWKRLYFTNKNTHQNLFPEENSYFDESTNPDFSKNESYLKINKITHGTLSSEANEEEYERAYCAFIEMSSGCIVRQETGSFCGGAWIEKENTWMWAGEEITIDEREPDKLTSNADIEMLSEIGGPENVSRCTKPKDYLISNDAQLLPPAVLRERTVRRKSRVYPQSFGMASRKIAVL